MFISFLVFTVSCSSDSKPYFWKAEKDGKTSWLLGTYHNGISLNELLCSDAILVKLKNSDLVLTELGKPLDEQKQSQWNKDLYYSPEGRDFKQLSSESQRFLEQRGVNKQLSYNALSSVLSNLCMEDVIGEVKARISMDEQVESIAIQSGIPLQALDNLELRKPIKNLITKEYIEEMISTLPLCSEFMRAYIASYKKGIPLPYEAKGLARWVKNRYSTTENNELILKNRNEKWFNQYKSAHKNYNHIFIAAGANHFTEAFNLVDMLRRDDFDVERRSCKNKNPGF